MRVKIGPNAKYIKGKEGLEFCTNCGKPWIASEKYPSCCDACFCPDTYCTIVDDVGCYQSGVFKNLVGDPLSLGAIGDLKAMVEEQISMAVPPMSWEKLCEIQPSAKRLFDPPI